MSILAMATQDKHPFGDQEAYDHILPQYGYHNNQGFQLKTSGLNTEYSHLSFGSRGQPNGSFLPQHPGDFSYTDLHGTYAPRQEINTAFSSLAHQNLPIRTPLFQNAPPQMQPMQRAQQLQQQQQQQPQQMQQVEQMEQPNIGDYFGPPPYQDDATKDRRDSIFIKDDDASPDTLQISVGRRRKSEYAEPGSARAIYLEKNRKAASKCRNKQKQEQEELVKRARDVESKNRVLKNEVEYLRKEVQDIKGLIALHANCQDERIAAYLEREADCAARHQRTHCTSCQLSG
ncbi:hypothetical protein CFE70_003994 [Pyrenophora teres f. teres 0-1]|uniref:BZIP domain-containing protein n=2 Tax=Pyrenophora teres f. teres TaxID=97479 RepID=E3RQE2_PYRTT|nr:hypothetical protein PTT_10929 [Pyrenophora teres f. teres 0-1]KAE8845535.1 hypothetical protein HRS9139_00102 [Pyrenophora teres f. teres]KAE8847673.1 hypothetical protein PTNB85_01516 [Pyrenophora teres f. teres]KAE8854170.1 hypothetical protein HRS9122_01162 [Pyrenophora teres f. teres]KAE8867601.1 hypothetical protein PTNB29_01512 [Pyrenophora teres f. teres]